MDRISVTDEQISAAQAGDGDAMWKIVQALDPMLKQIIRTAVPRANADDMEDLLQEGRAVVIQHVHDYDSVANAASLTSFVYREVRRTVQEAHVGMTTPVAIDAATVLEVRRALWSAAGNVDDAWTTLSAEPAKRRMSRERFMGALEALASTDSFDAPVNGEDADGSGLTLSDVVADPTSSMTDDVVRRDYARWLMTQIPARQSYALRAFYGVHMTAVPDAEAAAHLGVKTGTVRALRTSGCASARRAADLQAWLIGQAPTSNALAA